jgi:photosystem II stability/assembly factor-like uncharacterized protein
MDDLDRRFESLDGIKTGDVWAQVQRRSAADPQTPPHKRSSRVGIILAAFALFAVAAGLAWRLWDHETSPAQQPPPVDGSVPKQASGDLPNIKAMSFTDPSHGFLVSCHDPHCRHTELLATQDGGRTWETRGADPPTVISFVGTIGYGARQTGANGKPWTIVRTDDAGATWTRVGVLQAPEGAAFTSLTFVDPSNGWAVVSGRIYRTADGGRTWTGLNAPCTEGSTLSDATIADSSTGYAMCTFEPGTDMEPKQLFRTDDGGNSWRLVSSVGMSFAGASVPDTGRLEITGYNDRLTFVSDQTGFLLTDRGGVDMTTDGGVTFRRIVVTDDVYSPVDVSLSDNGTGFLALWSGQILATTDSGQTWVQRYPTPTPSLTDAYSFLTDTAGIGIVDTGSLSSGPGGEPSTATELARTKDGGETWTPIASSEDALRAAATLQMVTADTVFALRNSGHHEVLRSDDGGATWKALAMPRGVEPEQMSWVDDSTGYVLSSDGDLLRTTDGGSQWTKIPQRPELLAVDAASSSDIWGGFRSSGGSWSGIASRSTDGGVTWQDATLPVRLTTDYFTALDSRHVWLSGSVCPSPTSAAPEVRKPGQPCRGVYGAILRTTDGGTTWQVIKIPRLIGDMQFVSPMDGFAHDGQLLETHDGGLTWSSVSPPR